MPKQILHSILFRSITDGKKQYETYIGGKLMKNSNKNTKLSKGC